jgi:pimeloyl-ACP methyl ester carboxylesterase
MPTRRSREANCMTRCTAVLGRPDDARRARTEDRLQIERAHLVGHSTGGAIGQTMAVRNPDRLISLTISASWTKADPFFRPLFEARRALLTSVLCTFEPSVSPSRLVRERCAARSARKTRRSEFPAGRDRRKPHRRDHGVRPDLAGRAQRPEAWSAHNEPDRLPALAADLSVRTSPNSRPLATQQRMWPETRLVDSNRIPRRTAST